MTKLFDLKPVKPPAKKLTRWERAQLAWGGKGKWWKDNGGDIAKVSLIGSAAGAGCFFVVFVLAVRFLLSMGLYVSACYGVYQGIALGMDWRTQSITDMDIAMLVIFGVSVLYRIATSKEKPDKVDLK